VQGKQEGSRPDTSYIVHEVFVQGLECVLKRRQWKQLEGFIFEAITITFDKASEGFRPELEPWFGATRIFSGSKTRLGGRAGPYHHLRVRWRCFVSRQRRS
jgi:hypothetical protein